MIRLEMKAGREGRKGSREGGERKEEQGERTREWIRKGSGGRREEWSERGMGEEGQKKENIQRITRSFQLTVTKKMADVHFTRMRCGRKSSFEGRAEC